MIGPTNALTVTGTVDPGSVTVGSNLKPIKLVNGVATAVDNDLVSTVANQTIGGSKTFSKPIYNNENNGEGLELRRTDWSVASTPSTDVTKQVIFRGATNGNWDSNPIASIIARRTNGGNSCVRLEARNYWNTTIHNSGIEIWAQNVGNAESHFVTAPVRTYLSSNTSDVVTIGSLQNSTDVVHRAGTEDRPNGYLTSRYYGKIIASPIQASANNKWIRWCAFDSSYSICNIVEMIGTRGNNEFFYVMFNVSGGGEYARYTPIITSGPNNVGFKIVTMRNTSNNKHEIWIYSASTVYTNSIWGGLKIGLDPTIINEEYDALPSTGYASITYMLGSA